MHLLKSGKIPFFKKYLFIYFCRQEKLDKLMNDFLIENGQLEVGNCRLCAKKDSISDLPNLCLWPYSKSQTFRKNFICKNETFDEQGRLIINFDKKYCPLEKITIELYRQYQPLVREFQDSKFFQQFLF